MAAYTDVILDLRQGYTPAQIAVRHDCNLAWVEMTAARRQPDTASSRLAAAGRPRGRVIPFKMPLVTSSIAPPMMWRMACPLGSIARAA